MPLLCADFQEAVVDHLIHRLDKLIRKKRFSSLVIAGGVSANSRLRKKAQKWALENRLHLVLPPLRYCTDNAAMIGFAGVKLFEKGLISPVDLNCHPHFLPGDFFLS